MSSSDIEANKCNIIPRRVSLVWKYFDKLNNTRIKCRLCGHEQNYQCTTGNILRHLKNKHDLDATINGMKDPKNIQRMHELDQYYLAKGAIGVCSFINEQHLLQHKLHKQPQELTAESLYANLLTANPLDRNLINYNGQSENINNSKTTRELKDDRLVAEIQCFREEAAYFRMQKFVATLQAKKLQLELDELYAKHNKKRKLSK